MWSIQRLSSIKIPTSNTSIKMTMSYTLGLGDQQVRGFINLREEASSGDKEGAMPL